MRIVLDTNCLLVALPRKSRSRWLYEAIRDGIIELAVTEDILKEYEEQIGDFYSPNVGSNTLKIFANLSNVIPINVFYYWQLIEVDKDDNKFVDCAVASQANFIITHDRHFNVLKTIEFPSLKCLTIAEFKIIFNETLSK